MATADDDGASRLWSLVGAFVDADAYQRPAASSAREFIRNALTYGRFGPGDLAGLVAPTELVLRSAPPAAAYAELLDDLRAECDRWVGAERANVALDLADLPARAACPDHEARLRLALALLQPLHAHQGRLDPSEAMFARQLSGELATGLEWATPTGDEAAVPFDPARPGHGPAVLLGPSGARSRHRHAGGVGPWVQGAPEPRSCGDRPVQAVGTQRSGHRHGNAVR
jgi:hypothetical protein